MATPTLPILLLLGFLLAATAAARPCKTLFYFSATTTTTYYPQIRNPNNPNSILAQNPRYVTLIFTSTTTSAGFPNRHQPLNFDRFNSDSRSSSPDFPFNFHPSVSSSVRDRTRDILSVVGALLFGVGCGALTAAAMYFVWALLSSRSVDLDDAVSSSSSDDDDDRYDDVTAAKKKLGYVAIPAMVGDDLKKAAPPAKEVV